MGVINIGKDFSDHPIGRFYSDGPGSGEEFREEFLKPAIKALRPDERLEVIIDDGVDGYGSSFLVEGFAGLVKYGYYRSQYLNRILVVSFSDPDFEFFKKKIFTYINEAAFGSEKYISTKEM